MSKRAREVIVTVDKDSKFKSIEIDGLEIPFVCGVNVGRRDPYDESSYEVAVTIPVDGIKMVKEE